MPGEHIRYVICKGDTDSWAENARTPEEVTNVHFCLHHFRFFCVYRQLIMMLCLCLERTEYFEKTTASMVQW
jgi:DNA polymerase elongation subunit (family B)